QPLLGLGVGARGGSGDAGRLALDDVPLRRRGEAGAARGARPARPRRDADDADALRHRRGGRRRGKAAMNERSTPPVSPRLLSALVCPATGGRLIYDPERQELISKSANLAY